VDGTVLAIQSFGTGPAVVLAHGWGLDHRLWGHQIVQLSRDCRVITYDLRGHGSSEPARGRGGGYSFDLLGEDLEAVLATALGGETPALIAGHSLGATSIASWARQRDVRGRAQAVGLLHLGVGNAVSERLLLRIMPVGGGEAGGDSRVHDAVIRYVAFANPTDGQVHFYEEMLSGCPPEVRRECLKAIADPAVHDGLRALALPTTVISGEQDKLAAPAEVSAIANSLPDLRELVELPGTGHMSPLEQPEQVSLRLRELLAGAPDGQRS
jgi:pimeloyl-ACP methyl ester carboxylesterase